MSKINTPVTLLGLLAMVVAVLGVLFVGQIINPPGDQIVVAVVEMPAGTVLTKDMVRVDTVHGNPKVAAAHVTAAELDQFIGAVVVEPIHQYSYIPKAALNLTGNPAAANRMALALADPKIVAMVVPATAATAPDAITEGDRVDLIFGTTGQSHSGQRLTTRPTQPAELAAQNEFGNIYAQPGAAGPTPTEPAATETPEPLLELPVAKTIVRQAQVLAVVREQKSSTTTDASGKAVETVTPGAMLALVVAVPREATELVQFAIDNGDVRISLLSAQVTTDAASREPTLGMTWNDLTSLMRMDRQAALDAVTQPVIGPGAYAVESTRDAETQAPSQDSATPIPAEGGTAADSGTPTATLTPASKAVATPTPRK